jgi:hypothetical protein
MQEQLGGPIHPRPGSLTQPGLGQTLGQIHFSRHLGSLPLYVK